MALALPPEDRDEAQALVAEEPRGAKKAGLTRGEGMALRAAAAALEGGSNAIELLEQSVGLLERPDAVLERARGLVELGAALRRLGHNVSAREPLSRGLELAHRWGPDRLENRAVEELGSQAPGPGDWRCRGWTRSPQAKPGSPAWPPRA